MCREVSELNLKIKTYEQALEKVFILDDTRDYSLVKVRKAFKLLNNPLKNVKIIHIAGTNWKGSTSKMVFSVLKNYWKKVWAFTQPHLIDVRERIISHEWEISKKDFIELLNKVLELNINFSFFEKHFLISCLFFEKKWLEYWILETWIWGLNDSTNITSPIITAITSVSIDHIKTLWNNIEEISFQKAGIIKNNIPIVYNHENNVIKKIAEEKKAPIIFTNKKIKTNLVWEYQMLNAWIAFEICKYLLYSLPLKSKEVPEGGRIFPIILEWLQKVEHFWRLQYITPNLLIDWAHNEAGLEELKKYLLSLDKNIKLCFAQKKWKTWDKILKVFNLEKNFILVDSENKLMVENADVLSENIKGLKLSVDNLNLEIKTVNEIFELSEENKDNLYVIFGSLYMIWEFLKFMI